MNAISMTSGNNEINAALLDIWCEIALPYEDELEDCFNSIKEQYNGPQKLDRLLS